MQRRRPASFGWPNAFDARAWFKELGIRVLSAAAAARVPAVNDVELSVREFSGPAGIQQFLKPGGVG
jgi:hypothetical protein